MEVIKQVIEIIKQVNRNYGSTILTFVSEFRRKGKRSE